MGIFSGDKKYYYFLAALVLIFAAISISAPKAINWKATYSKKDKNPYGNFILYDLLSETFDSKLRTVQQPAYNQIKEDSSLKANYIFVNDIFVPDTFDTKELVNFVERGNNVFIAANSFFGDFADALKLETEQNTLFFGASDSNSLNFVNQEFEVDPAYKFRRNSAENYFASFDTTRSTILGINDSLQATYIKTTYGDGAFYLSANPLAFTNFHLMHEDNAYYIFKSLSYLPKAEIWWDEFYKVGRDEAKTPLRFILKTPALKWAWMLLLFGGLLYMISNAKRKQKIIPALDPFKNTSVEFTETIGMLYFNNGNHKDLADKKIKYFFEFVRRKFGLKTDLNDWEFPIRLAQKSGMTEEDTAKLLTEVKRVKSLVQINEEILIKLNTAIDNFYTKTSY